MVYRHRVAAAVFCSDAANSRAEYSVQSRNVLRALFFVEIHNDYG